MDWAKAGFLKVGSIGPRGESGSNSGETGDEERVKVPIGSGGGLKVERDRGARGVIEAMCCSWCKRSRSVESRFEC